MRAIGDTQVFKNISATPAAFSLDGGVYAMQAVATWSAGNVDLQRLAADGATYVSCGAATKMTANGFASGVYLPRGKYQFAVTTATALYVELQRVPSD